VGFAPHSLSPAELEALHAAERRHAPFLCHRDGAGELRLTPLRDVAALTIGRAHGNDIVLGWDAQVSRTHAQLTQVGASWTVVDDGLSRNGCFVNGDRVQGRRRLDDGDVLSLGKTTIVFRAPGPETEATLAASGASFARLTQAEMRVLIELCRPLPASGFPATNGEIGARLYLSEAGVKTHIRALFTKLDIEDLPKNRKRAELARRALEAGMVTERALRE
jgi:DNA-binding CsgD family transcriptional regulator